MRGTIFSVTEAMRPMPPMNTNAAITPRATPTPRWGNPKAVWKASAMELDCTMFPMKPRATMMATEKNAAMAGLPKPSRM